MAPRSLKPTRRFLRRFKVKSKALPLTHKKVPKTQLMRPRTPPRKPRTLPPTQKMLLPTQKTPPRVLPKMLKTPLKMATRLLHREPLTEVSLL